MEKTRKEAIKDGDGEYWWKGWVRCGVCEHRQKSAIEIPVEWKWPVIRLECEECGEMTCDPEMKD